jgi:hypothetical protein
MIEGFIIPHQYYQMVVVSDHLEINKI